MGKDAYRGPEKRANAEKPPIVRPWLLVVLGVLVLVAGWLGVGYFVGTFLNENQRGPAKAQAQNAAEREQRMKPGAFVALAPLPDKLPLVERAGVDNYGYPRSYVDRAALRSLLGWKKYRDLTTYIEQFQADMERDFRNEFLVTDAIDTFESAERELDTRLDAWVAATPDSFAPYAARGAHRFSVAFAQRGSEWASETSRENVAGMEAAFALAFEDLEHALRLNPRAMPARSHQIRIAFSGAKHGHEFDAMCARAFEICPGCIRARIIQQLGLEPRWGGSYVQMAAAARRAPIRLNPRFVQLAGYEQLDRADLARGADDLKTARLAAERAAALGPSADFSLELAKVLSAAKDPAGALKAIDQALDLRPMREDLLAMRARLYSLPEIRDWERAYKDLVLALRIEPTNEDARDVLPYIAHGLADAGWAAHQRGDELQAIRLLDEGMDLLPNRQWEQRRNVVLTSGYHGKPEELVALEAAAKAAPHDFHAHVRLDYALSQSAQWPKIAAMWGAFIAENPSEGRAYWERGGTLSHLGQRDAAHADSVRACELGVSVACAMAQR